MENCLPHRNARKVTNYSMKDLESKLKVPVEHERQEIFPKQSRHM